MQIHPTAIVDATAELGTNVEVGPFAVIGANVKIGDGTRVGPHAVIFPFTTIGANCAVHAHAVVGDLPQDLVFKSDTRSYVVIGDNVTVRENVTIHRGTKPETQTVVGDGCFLMACAHVAHNCKLGQRVILANNALLAGYVEIGDGVFISGGVVIHQFTRIGRLALLSGNSAVGKDIPPFCVTLGASRNTVAGMNVIGMRRAGFGVEQRKQIKRAFELMYLSGKNFRDVPDLIRAEFPEGPAREIADFIAESKRGLCAFRDRSAGDDEAG